MYSLPLQVKVLCEGAVYKTYLCSLCLYLKQASVTLSISGLSADLDLFVLADETCDGSGCLGHSENSDVADESITFSATAKASYLVVVDGWEDAQSGFTLHADCEGGWPADPTDSGADSGDSAGETAEDSGLEKVAGFCACSSGERVPAAPFVGLLLWVLALGHRGRSAAYSGCGRRNSRPIA